MLLSEIATRVKRLFGDESGVQIDDTDIIRWVNDGQLDIVRKTHCVTRNVAVNSTAGINSYPIPGDFLFFKEAKYGGRLLSSISAEDFNARFPNRELSLARGVSEYFTVRGTNYLLFPYPNTTGVAISLYYVARPAVMAAVTETPEIPIAFHEALVKFTLMRANELNEDWVASQKFQKDYAEDVIMTRSDTQWSDAGGYPVVRDYEEGGW